MEPNKLYQLSLLSSMVDGIGTSGTTTAVIPKHGDHGIGTFRDINGEGLFIDGEVYQMTFDGNIRKIEGDEEEDMPWAQVTRFVPSVTEKIEAPLGDKTLLEKLREVHPNSDNLFVAVRIDGVFKEITTRVCPKQQFPRQRIMEIVRQQKVTKSEGIEGTAFGVRSPPFMDGISVPGMHYHFISADRKFGGHVLGFELASGTVGSAVMKDIHLELPTTAEFNSSSLRVTENISNA